MGYIHSFPCFVGHVRAGMIHLYVEHLLNIRTLSIQANLTTVSNRETNATLSADGKILTLTHEGEKASITLPIILSPTRESTATLTIPAVPSKTLTFRVQLEEKESQLDGHSSLQNPSLDQSNVIPWMSESLSKDTEILCLECRSILVARDRSRSWKDLPSEGWAEMMEFWHCHKPHDSHSAGSHVKKGYAADAKLGLDVGIGMVDPLEFLLAPGDCANVEVRFTCSSYPLSRRVSIFLHIHIFRANKNRSSRAVWWLSRDVIRDTLSPRMNRQTAAKRESTSHKRWLVQW